MTATQADTVAELQRANEELRRERDAALSEKATLAEALATRTTELAKRTSELATRNSEDGERFEQHAATIDVLKVMSSTPDDTQPVFDLIVRRATELCNGLAAALYQFDGSLVYFRAVYHCVPDPDRFAAVAAMFPMAPTREVIACRAILDREIVHIRDTEAEPGLSQVVRQRLRGSHRSQVSIPLMRDSQAIGAISLGGKEPGGFTDSQIALLETFAEQAVIAITSAETYRALQTRTTALQELLEYQTATSNVLNVISRSTFDLEPVLETVVQTSARLCNADRAAIFRREGDLWRLAVNFGFPPAWEDYMTAQGAFSLDRFSGHAAVRAVVERRPVHIDDMAAVPGYGVVRLGEQRTTLGVPLLREGEAIGTIVLARLRVEPFTDRQIELVSTFADQAVIAIENTRLITEQREALDQQTATAEVLRVINASPGNLAPVFEAILEKAHRICGATIGSLMLYDGECLRAAATHGFAEEFADLIRQPFRPSGRYQRLIDGERFVQAMPVDAISLRQAEVSGVRSTLAVPLRKDTVFLGAITAHRTDVRPFDEKEIVLLENFAAQAVIAMENARLITETREALEQQTATAEVLQVINSSPGDLAPVFDAMLDRARKLCGADIGTFWYRDGSSFRVVASSAQGDTGRTVIPAPGTSLGRIAHGADVVQIDDVTKEEGYRTGVWRERTQRVGTRTALAVPLRKDDELVGAITTGRREVRRFTENQIGLLQNFAAQAVIAMENARLLNEIRQRQAELRTTFDNMGDGVAMFDADLRLAAWNRNFQRIIDLPDTLLGTRPRYADYLRLLAERGEFGTRDVEAELSLRIEDTEKELRLERVRPDGRVIEVRRNAVPGGGFVLIYSDITERKRSEEEIRAARDSAETALRELKTAQANLIQAEKMASLGQLTAGIAHEIKNPLNFVNNFAALSVDLLSELKETAAPGLAALTDKQRTEVEEVSAMLTSNLEKINEHGKRADGIVKAMLEHSRGSSAEQRLVDLNTLIDEALNLAYHGARAQDQSFNITLERDFGGEIAPVEVNPQDITRVFLNLFANGFYAVTRRAREGGDASFVPTLKVTTCDGSEGVEIRVRDNGAGIPADIRDKLFQPFFTTKPTGEGTGLGLSITYDIVTQQHGGSIAVDSKVGDYSEFTIRLPRSMGLGVTGQIDGR